MAIVQRSLLSVLLFALLAPLGAADRDAGVAATSGTTGKAVQASAASTAGGPNEAEDKHDRGTPDQAPDNDDITEDAGPEPGGERHAADAGEKTAAGDKPREPVALTQLASEARPTAQQKGSISSAAAATGSSSAASQPTAAAGTTFSDYGPQGDALLALKSRVSEVSGGTAALAGHALEADGTEEMAWHDIGLKMQDLSSSWKELEDRVRRGLTKLDAELGLHQEVDSGTAVGLADHTDSGAADKSHAGPGALLEGHLREADVHGHAAESEGGALDYLHEADGSTALLEHQLQAAVSSQAAAAKAAHEALVVLGAASADEVGDILSNLHTADAEEKANRRAEAILSAAKNLREVHQQRNQEFLQVAHDMQAARDMAVRELQAIEDLQSMHEVIQGRAREQASDLRIAHSLGFISGLTASMGITAERLREWEQNGDKGDVGRQELLRQIQEHHAAKALEALAVAEKEQHDPVPSLSTGLAEGALPPAQALLVSTRGTLQKAAAHNGSAATVAAAAAIGAGSDGILLPLSNRSH